MKLLIVESLTKAKTINKYLGSDFRIVASYGHIRDLPAKSGSVLPNQDFLMKYELLPSATTHVAHICQLAREADDVYLATDPDREGEAISWHIVEVLKANRIISNFKRIVFHEITKKAVNDAIQNPRDININLVNAQQARRSLDYLVGFHLSPLLWRKLPGCKSAGRVQSVGLKLICEREAEIMQFVTQEYWTIHIEMQNSKSLTLTALLTIFNGKKLEKFSITNESQVQDVAKVISNQQFKISDISNKKQRRSPYPPFITSTLQQEAATKLGFTAKKTMMIAQKLYEGISIDNESTALITYMRTDSVVLSKEFVEQARGFIKINYGKDYLPASSKIYKSKVKNAQEAHEAIRPINVHILPSSLSDKIDNDYLKLYELIWRRAVACQMENAIFHITTITLISSDNLHTARASNTILGFDGFYKVYKDGSHQDSVDQAKNSLPKNSLPSSGNFLLDEILSVLKVLPSQHFTEPPPRYSEATLIKTLEELGIGRPSTYVSIIGVLQDRGYVILEKKRFIPHSKGKLVTAFLTLFFKKYIEYDFTANLENALDEIAKGNINWTALLESFWHEFNDNIKETTKYKIADVISQIEMLLFNFLFPNKDDSTDPKLCNSCKKGQLQLKFSKYGAFLACNNNDECNFISNIPDSETSTDSKKDNSNNNLIGYANVLNKNIYLKNGPFGWYIQAGEDSNNDGEKPQRISVSLFKCNKEEITLEIAEQLLSLPKTIGLYPENSQEIILCVSKYGPYLKYNNKFIPVPKECDYLNLSLEQSINIINEFASKPSKSKKKKNQK